MPPFAPSLHRIVPLSKRQKAIVQSVEVEPQGDRRNRFANNLQQFNQKNFKRKYRTDRHQRVASSLVGGGR